MKTLLIAFCLLFTYPVISQQVTKDFYLKKSLKQDGLQLQFTVLDEDKKGVWHYQRSKFYFWYKAQKVMATQGGASGQLLNGNYEAFHENKQLAQKGKFCRGLKDGEWLYWRADGTLRLIEVWKNGTFSGKQVRYTANGEIEEQVEYGLFRSKLIQGDSCFVIRRKYGKGEVGSWKMDEGIWKVDDGERKKEKGKPYGKLKDRLGKGNTSDGKEKGRSKKEVSDSATNKGKEKGKKE